MTTSAKNYVPPVLRAVLYEKDGLFYGVCLESFLMAVTDIEDSLPGELEGMIDAHMAACEETGRAPFEGLVPAPKQYWDMYAEGVRRERRSQLLEPVGLRPAVQLLAAA